MKLNKILILLLAGSVSCGAFAQVGLKQEACRKAWGASSSGELDADGNGTLRYHSRGTSVEMEFEKGYALRATYRKEKLTERDLDSLLRLNNGDVSWSEWMPPGIPAEELKESIWLRSDEMAMAKLRDGVLRIVGNPPLEEQPEKIEVCKPAEPSEKSSKSAVPASFPEPKKTVVKKAAKPMPEKTISQPGQMPAVGDSKETALTLLGTPSGVMKKGDVQIHIYSWGSVWISDEKVIQIN